MTIEKIGANKNEIDTPAVCIDLDRMESNISRMVGICQENGISWRPHSKCHKSPQIGRKLVDAGALGITCAKLGEAEVLAAAGIPELLIANLVVGPRKMERLVELRKIADPVICADHIDQVRGYSEAMAAAGLELRVIAELDIGLDRVGVAPLGPAVELCQAINDAPGLKFAGIMGYEGHLLTIEDEDEKQKQIHAALDLLVQTVGMLEEKGLSCDIVSCGGTGCYPITATHKGITEMQAGGAIFMDAFYQTKCGIDDLQMAMTVVATVVSRPTPDRAIIDAGRKTMAVDSATPQCVSHDNVEPTRFSAEHGELQLSGDLVGGLPIGTRVEIIPGYSDMTTVLHDQLYAFRGDTLEEIFEMPGRGRVQ